jgi:hypothetical protein
MGFKVDISEHLTATLETTKERAMAAVLQAIKDQGESAMLIDGFSDDSGQLTLGFKERGAKQMAKTWLKGGYGGIVTAVKRHTSLSPIVTITVSTAGSGRIQVATKITDYASMQGMFYSSLIGRDPHKKFLTDLGVALKSADPSTQISIGS